MRILVFLHSFEPGGVERVALRLAGAWAEAGEEVRMVVGRQDGPQQAIAPKNIDYEFAPPSSLARIMESFWLAWNVIRSIRRDSPDVLFCAGSTYVIVAALVRLALRGECPPIVAKLSNSLERRDLPWPARACYWLWLRFHPFIIDRVAGMADPMRQEIEQYLGIPSDRIAIVPDPAVNSDELRMLAARTLPQRTGRRFIAVGRLAAQKNFSLLIRAFARMAGPNDRLTILGEGPQRKRLIRLARRLGIEKLIEMPGHVGSVVGALKAADVFVSSSNYEGLPSVVVEALAAGLPIVATDCSACMAYLLGYGELGRLVPIRNSAALASAMRDAAAANDLPLEAMHSAAARFSIERSSGLYLDVLAATAAGSEASRRTRRPAMAGAA